MHGLCQLSLSKAAVSIAVFLILQFCLQWGKSLFCNEKHDFFPNLWPKISELLKDTFLLYSNKIIYILVLHDWQISVNSRPSVQTCAACVWGMIIQLQEPYQAVALCELAHRHGSCAVQVHQQDRCAKIAPFYDGHTSKRFDGGRQFSVVQLHWFLMKCAAKLFCSTNLGHWLPKC